MKLTVSSKTLEQVSTEALVVIHEKAGMLGTSGNAALAGHLKAFQKDVDGKKTRREWFCTLEKGAGCRTRHLLLESATFGDYAPHDEPLKMAASRAVELCRQYSIPRLAVAVHHKLAAAKAAAILEGIMLGDFRDERFKGKTSREKRPELDLEFLVEKGAEKAVKAELERRRAICDGQNAARELTNAPNNVLTPESMAAHARALARRHGMQCTVLNKKQLRAQGYEPTYEVGRGSEHSPRLMVLRHSPARAKATPHIALVGKGMTFDTGGLCLKPRDMMHRMNNDMGGAAAVLGAMEAIGQLKLPIRVTAIIASAHNAIDGAAYHPGSIIKARNGKTIYVENTDAEGRLILTDCLYRAGEEKADIVWDFATLTGSVKAALGPSFAGLFTDDEEMRSLFLEAGQNCGDEVWPLPLVREYEASIRHTLADLVNISSEPTAGGIHAANFLRQFVPEGVRWVHVDIAGIADTKARWRYYRTAGGTGYGVRLILEALRLFAG